MKRLGILPANDANPREYSFAKPAGARRTIHGSSSYFRHPAPRSLPQAFSLLEVLVAVAVLSMMLAFMFSLLGSSLSLWESGNRRIEAAQAARVGLSIMANDLKNAFAGNMTSYTSNGTPIQNIAPFVAIDSPGTDAIDIPSTGQAINAEGSEQVYGVLSSGDANEPFKEFGFLCVFIGNKNGTDPMIGHRYYLVRKLANGSSGKGDFFLRTPDTGWKGTSTTFFPLIDNCIRLTFKYYGNPTNPSDPPTWSQTWLPTDRLPLGILITATVLDSRTAEKIAATLNGTPLSSGDIDSIFTNPPTSNPTPIQRLLGQGAVTVRRFVPLNAN